MSVLEYIYINLVNKSFYKTNINDKYLKLSKL